MNLLMLLILVATLPSLAQINASAGERANTSSDIKPIETIPLPLQPGYVARSVKELKELQRLNYQSPVPVEMVVNLTFVGPSWSTIFAADGKEPLLISCTAAVSEFLAKEPLGTRLRVRGMSLNGQWGISLANYEVLPGIDFLPNDRENVSLVDGKLPANIFLKGHGRVQELFASDKLFSLAVVDSEEVCRLELYAPVTETEGVKFLGRQVEYAGVFSPTTDGTVHLGYQVRLFKEQLNLVPAADAVSHDLSSLHLHRGEVVYSNNKSHFVLATSDDVLLFRTRFSKLLPPGSVVGVYEISREPTPQYEGERLCSFVVLYGLRSATDTNEIAAQSLLSGGPRPTRISLTGRVEACKREGNDLLLQLTSNAVSVSCLIPEFDRDECLRLDLTTRAEDVSRGDIVRVTGAVRLSSTSAGDTIGNQRTAQLHIYSTSSRDLAILEKAHHFTFMELMSAIGIFASLMLISIAGNWFLKRAVDTRTKRLTVVSQRLQAIFESMHVGLLFCDADGKVVGGNRGFVNIFGFAPKQGETESSLFRQLCELMADARLIQDMRREAAGKLLGAMSRTIRLSHGAKPLEVVVSCVRDTDGTLLGQLWSFEDIAKKLEFENEVIEWKKLDTTENLSTGVAHDFNNLLTVIRSNIMLIEHLVGSPENLKSRFESADLAIERAAVLTQYLLDHSRRSTLQLTVTDMRQIVLRIELILRSAFPKTLILRVCVPDEPLPVLLDNNRFEQVLINLCVNARDALPNSTGEITILAEANQDAVSGRKVRVAVIDNGHGMSEEVVARVFEPFFSTKAPGKGTGLGLAMAHGVVLQLGGTIRCNSELGKGSTFEIMLPMAIEAANTNLATDNTRNSLANISDASS